MKLSDIKPNPNNPRVIKDDKFEKLKKSISEFPKMMELVDTMIIVSENMITLGKSKNGKVQYRLKECEHCLNWFNTKDLNKKYCSKECYSESMKMNKTCKLCGDIIQNKHSVSIKNRVYCSKKCQSEARKNVPLSKDWRIALSNGRKKSEKCKGENTYNWKGGEETRLIRNKSYFYKRKKSLKKEMPISFLHNILKAQKNKCFFCEEDLTNYKAIEHLTPISRGGDNDVFNLVYSCKKCNSQKGQKTLEEFAIIKNNIDLIDKWEIIYSEAI